MASAPDVVSQTSDCIEQVSPKNNNRHVKAPDKLQGFITAPNMVLTYEKLVSADFCTK